MKKSLLFLGIIALLGAGACSAQGKKPAAKYEKATFAGGCFWCMQPPFDKTQGVIQTTVGYTGGKEKNPTYEQVSSKQTGHQEAIDVTFDPSVVTFEQLLEVYWHRIDPTQPDGQFADIGPQYRTYIYYHSEEQRKAAEASKEALAKSGKFSKPIAVQIVPASIFWPAEEYHQKYYKKNAAHYYSYAVNSGRYPYIQRVWGIDPMK